MKNGVLETIGSTLITGIGQLMGRLIGVNSIEDGILYFVHQPAKSGQQGDLASTVFVEDGKYYLYNPEVQKNDRFVSGALPGMGNIGAQTVTLGKRQSFDITPLFQQGADHDNTSFEITACQAGQVKLGSQQSSLVQISTSGKLFEVGQQRQSLGAYMDVQVSQDEVTILPKGKIKLDSLPTITVQTQGQGVMSAANIESQGGEEAVFPLTQQLLSSDLVNVSVTANVDTMDTKEFLTMQPFAHLIQTVDDETAARIAKAPRLNRR